MGKRSPRASFWRYIVVMAAGVLLLCAIVLGDLRHGVTVVSVEAGVAALFLIGIGALRLRNIRRQGRP